MRDKPFISSQEEVAELTLKTLCLAVILTVLLAMSNAFLALKLGILTSASIPAAIISMAVLRFFRQSTILENNAVQTAASAGEAVAGGIVYTIPALIIIGYWHHFDYWTNVLIAACGGILGVLFSIPLRRILVHEPFLRFPEGRAIAEVLKSSSENLGARELVWGGLLGGLLELFQTGFKVIAASWSFWLVVKRTLFGLSLGFSATMIGAGYLVGFDMAVCIIAGALISWFIALPIVSHLHPDLLTAYPVEKAASILWSSQMRYFGIGAMLFAGLWTFIKLLKPLLSSMRRSLGDFSIQAGSGQGHARVDCDIPLPWILLGTLLTAVVLTLFFKQLLPVASFGFSQGLSLSLVLMSVVYVLVIGFLFSVITAYFSGMVGVTASPGSSVVIAGLLFAAWLLLLAIKAFLPLPLTAEQVKAAEAITIIIGSVVTGIAAIANDNTQDLKVGQLVGATPWKQQLMLLLGVVVSSLVIPPVMQILFEVYGIAGVMPHSGMDPAQSLPAPVAAMMAGITEAVFQHTLPWNMVFAGMGLMVLILILNRLLGLDRWLRISILGVGIGMYLPLATSFPLFLGGLFALMVQRRLQGQQLDVSIRQVRTQRGVLIACGLVAGAALMDVLLAIPFSLMHSPDAMSLVSPSWEPYALLLAVVSTLGLWLGIDRQVRKE